MTDGESESTGVSILIVDDNPVVRMGLRSLLETDPDITVVGEAADGDEALRVAERTAPAVVLLDVRMPRRDGVSVVAELSERSKVIMLTFTEEGEVVRKAVGQGAVGYIVHGSFDAPTLSQTIKSAAIGMGSFSPSVMSSMRSDLTSIRSGGLREGEHGLSARQVEVMEAISAGKANGDIATALFLSEKTVKNHINQIFAKLGVANRGEAIALWLGSHE